MSDPNPTAEKGARRRRAFARSGVMLGIGLKIASVFVFVAMSSLVKAAEGVPVGQAIFFRSLFALVPVLIFLAFQRQLLEGFVTARPLGHVVRGLVGCVSMTLMFSALARLPLPEVVTIHYATPLFIVVFSALFLREKIRLFRWSAVMVGMVGVVIVMWPRLTVFTGDFAAMGSETVGAIAVFAACIVGAVAMLMVRTLVRTERSSTVVIYFSLVCTAGGLLTIPFGWVSLSPVEAAMLVGAGIAGGLGQILLTESYRHAEMSTIAPFEYASIVLSIVIGYVVFNDVPTPQMLIGGAIVVAAGIFIIYRESRLGVDHASVKKVSVPH